MNNKKLLFSYIFNYKLLLKNIIYHIIKHVWCIYVPMHRYKRCLKTFNCAMLQYAFRLYIFVIQLIVIIFYLERNFIFFQ